MSADRQLVATADSVVRANAADAPVMQAVRNLATAPDPAATYRALLTQIGSMYDQLGRDEAGRRLDAMAYESFSTAGDLQAWRDAQEKLANQLFVVDGGVPTGTPAFSSGGAAAQDAYTRPLRVIYVNGVGTGPYEALKTSWEIRMAALGAGFRFREPGAPYAVLHFYNASSKYLADGQKRDCTLQAAARARFTGILSWALLLDRCGIRDWIEAGTQLLSVLEALPAPAVEDARRLGERISEQLAAGNRVILVTHSQGNLMAQQALGTLTGNPGVTSCVGVISLAAPTSKNWPATAAFDGLVVGGSALKDMILRTGQNTLPPLATELSDKLEYEFAGIPWLSVPPPPVVMALSEIRLHSVEESYLGAPKSREWIVSKLRAQDEALATSCVRQPTTLRVTPSNAPVQVGDSVQLTVEVKDQDGNVIPNPQVVWASSAPAVATVSETGFVRGVSAGEARISARLGTLTDESLITVQARTSGPRLIWKFQDPAPNAAVSGVALGPTGTVYVLTGNHGAENRDAGALYALDPSNGREIWRLDGWSYTREGPVVGDDGTIYFTGTGGFGFAEFIAAVSPTSGTLKWVNGGTFGEVGYFFNPVVGPSGVIVVPGREGIWAFNASTGARRWMVSLPWPSDYPAVSEGGVLFVGSTDSTMNAIRISDGARLWTTKLGLIPFPVMSLTGSDVLFGATTEPVLMAVDRNTGAIRSRRTYTGMVGSSVTVGPNNMLYVNGTHGRFAAVDASTGRELWARSGKQVLLPASVAADGTILLSFVSSPSYEVHAINGATGTTAWTWVDHRLTGVLLPRASGIAYVFGEWSVSALAVDLPGLAVSPWPMMQHDPAKSSRAP